MTTVDQTRLVSIKTLDKGGHDSDYGVFCVMEAALRATRDALDQVIADPTAMQAAREAVAAADAALNSRGDIDA